MKRHHHFAALLLALALAGGRLAGQEAGTNTTGTATNTVEWVDTNAVFTGSLTNFGTVRVINSMVTYTGDYTENGTYFSDPSTNTFANLNIGAAGVLVGGVGDLFRFSGNFNNASTNWGGWDTVDAALTAFGVGSHNLQLPGVNPGLSSSGYTNNFAWGTFTLAVNNSLVLQDGNATPGAAMFVNNLVLGGGTNQLTSITGNGNSIYYDPAGASNAYLFNQTYALAGGGIIAPVLRSFWTNSTNLYVGYDRASNTFLITNGTGVRASNAFVGYLPGSTNNVLQITGGMLLITNSAGTGTLDVRRGTLSLNGGTNVADVLLVTNALATVAFNGGRMITRSTVIDDDFPLEVGDGLQIAELVLDGAGANQHQFVNGLVVKFAATVEVRNATVVASQIDLQGGTLLFGGPSSMTNRLGGVVPIRLAGGTLNTAGLSDSAGTLTLAANSTIDLGNGASVLHFLNSSGAGWTGGATLAINNWSGSVHGGGTDELIFGNSASGLTSAQVGHVSFNDPFGPGSGTYGALILPSGEVVPVPEPATWLAAGALLGLLGWRERHRFTRRFYRLGLQ